MESVKAQVLQAVHFPKEYDDVHMLKLLSLGKIVGLH